MPEGAPKEGEIFRHYKGKDYRVLGLAMHSDETWNVLYEPLYDLDIKLFTRPLKEWSEVVEFEGMKVPRFTKR